ncbi:phosphotransacetylase family protein [Methanomethylovorans sp.]|uniref:phosphotransacetylase family protein n=3 Tax=Methanomethylovorans sp. TaxID=2758717 RepID=UPI000AEC602B|nr:phosphotransacetylase family protein [Methanomethylovorans sp.]
MASMLVSSSEQYSGKSSLCLGLGVLLKERGYKVGYMKPIGNLLIDVNGSLADEDAQGIRKLLGLQDDMSSITPILLTENLTDDALMGVEKGLDSRLKEAYEKVSKGRDVVLLEGAGGIGGGAMYNLSDPEVATKLDTKILLITRYDSAQAVDRILCDLRIIQNTEILAGIILNEVPPDKLEQVSHLVVPFLEKKGIKVFGVIPEDHMLRSVSVAEIVEDLNAEVLVGASHMEDLVEHYLVGAMEVGSAIKYFRRMPNAAVITGGDRSDIQMAAIEAKVKCLVLTGNLRPSGAVLGSAEEANIPVILVRGDTMSTIEKMENLIGHARIKQEVKIKRIVDLIKEYVDVDGLITEMGLGK